MYLFTITDEGVVYNAAGAAAGGVLIGAWELGAPHATSFLRGHRHACPNAAHVPAGCYACCSRVLGPWRLVRERREGQPNWLVVQAGGCQIGHVNSAAAALLAPLVDEDLVDLQVVQTSPLTHSLRVYAKLGRAGNWQVVREAHGGAAARGYLGLLAGAMEALAAQRAMCTLPLAALDAQPATPPLAAAKKLPGAACWERAIGSTISADLVDALGSRVYAVLRRECMPRTPTPSCSKHALSEAEEDCVSRPGSSEQTGLVDHTAEPAGWSGAAEDGAAACGTAGPGRQVGPTGAQQQQAMPPQRSAPLAPAGSADQPAGSGEDEVASLQVHSWPGRRKAGKRHSIDLGACAGHLAGASGRRHGAKRLSLDVRRPGEQGGHLLTVAPEFPAAD